VRASTRSGGGIDVAENRFFPFWDFELGDCDFCKKKHVPVAKSTDNEKLCYECLLELAKALREVSKGV
jgi:hypothetical protein